MEFKPAIQFCYRVAVRSFLSHNGHCLPKTNLQYVSQHWHRGYKRAEIHAILGSLRQTHHKLFVLMAAESGLRSHVLMQLNYGHIKEDIESAINPVAIRLEPRFHIGKKAAGYTFFGDGSVRLIRECLDQHLIDASSESRLIPRSYYAVRTAIRRANQIIGLDPKIQTCHGLRKYFENALDDANVDHEKKMIIEGHFAGTRAKHYTDRDIEELRGIYHRAYPFFKLSVGQPSLIAARNEIYDRRLSELETRLDRHRVLEAKLMVLEDELHQMKRSQKQLEQRSCTGTIHATFS
jgi:integrase